MARQVNGNVDFRSLGRNFAISEFSSCKEILYRYNGRMLAHTEVQVITLWVSSADPRRALGPLQLPCGVRPRPSGRAQGGSETRPTTCRVSDVMDLAAAIRVSAGDDIASQSCVASSRNKGGRYVFTYEQQAAAAAIEKRKNVATVAAKSPPAQIGLLCRANRLPHLPVVVVTAEHN